MAATRESISPDGSRIATTRVVDGNWDIWIKQLPTGPFDRLTVAESEERYPVWTPDGDFVTYSSGEWGDMNVWQERADGSGEPFLLIDPEPTITQKAWSPDGEWLVVVNHDPTTQPGAPDIWGVRASAPDSLVPLVSSSDFLERMPRVSPDARWLAYSSDESGQSEVYVRPFPDTDAARIRVSTNGGHTAIWSHDGSELFFFTRDRHLVSAQVSSEGGFSVRSRTELFALDPDLLAVDGYGFVDVASDGRFLMGRLTTAGAETASVMVLVQGFGGELRDSVAGG